MKEEEIKDTEQLEDNQTVTTNEDTTNNKETETEEQAEEQKEQTPEEKIQELETKLAEVQKAMLYKVAEFENYRKRTIKEKADLILNGGKKVLEALLPVAAALERAEINIATASEVEALKAGLQLSFQ